LQRYLYWWLSQPVFTRRTGHNISRLKEIAHHLKKGFFVPDLRMVLKFYGLPILVSVMEGLLLKTAKSIYYITGIFMLSMEPIAGVMAWYA